MSSNRISSTSSTSSTRSTRSTSSTSSTSSSSSSSSSSSNSRRPPGLCRGRRGRGAGRGSKQRYRGSKKRGPPLLGGPKERIRGSGVRNKIEGRGGPGGRKKDTGVKIKIKGGQKQDRGPPGLCRGWRGRGGGQGVKKKMQEVKKKRSTRTADMPANSRTLTYFRDNPKTFSITTEHDPAPRRLPPPSSTKYNLVLPKKTDDLATTPGVAPQHPLLQAIA